MNKTPEISVIMSVYNGEAYLEECIESVLGQSFKNFEFIIVNDGSDDGTLEILKHYAQSDQRVKFIDLEKNIGIAGARNKAIDVVKGKYIAVMDADDICLENRLRVEFEYMESHPEIFLVGSNISFIDSDGKPLGKHWERDKKIPLDPEEIRDTILIYNPFWVNTIFFRNEPDLKFREKFVYSEDYDFYLNLLSKGKKLANHPNILVRYRIHESSVCSSKIFKVTFFHSQAKRFFLQRSKCGTDEYADFDPTPVLKLDPETTRNAEVLKVEIMGNFRRGNLEKTKCYLEQYFRYHGRLNLFLVYYLACKSKFFYLVFSKLNKIYNDLILKRFRRPGKEHEHLIAIDRTLEDIRHECQ